MLSAFWYVAGLTSVQLALVRGWQTQDIKTKVESFEEASHYQGTLMVPGGIGVVATGLFLWSALDYNLASTGWLIAVEVIYIVTLLLCLPFIGMGLRRGRIAALMAQRHGRNNPELEQAMADNVPLVFGGVAAILIPVAVALSVFRPF